MKSHQETPLTTAAARLARDLWKHPSDLVVSLIALALSLGTFVFNLSVGYFGYWIILIIGSIAYLLWTQISIAPLLNILSGKALREEIAITKIPPGEYLSRQLKEPLIRLFLPFIMALPAAAQIGINLLIFPQYFTDYKFYDWSIESGDFFLSSVILGALFLTVFLAVSFAILFGLIILILSRLENACRSSSKYDLNAIFRIMTFCLAPLFITLGVSFAALLVAFILFTIFHSEIPVVVIISLFPLALIFLAKCNFRIAKHSWEKLCAAYYEFE